MPDYMSLRSNQGLMGPRDIISLQDFAQRQRLQEQAQTEKVRTQAALSQPGGVDQRGLPSLQAISQITQINPEMGLRLAGMTEQLRLRDLQINESKQKAGMEIEKSYVEAFDRYLSSTNGNRQEALRQAQASRLAAIDEFESSGRAAQLGFSESDLNKARGNMRDPDMVRAVVSSMGGTISKPQAPLSDIGKLKADYDAGRISKKDYEAELAKKTAPSATSLAGTAVPSDEALTMAADQYLAGDTTAGQGYARNALAKKAFVEKLTERAKEKGMTGGDVAAKVAEFQGTKAAQRTAGTRSAIADMAVTEAQLMAPMALTASEKVDRTKSPMLNKVLLSLERGSGMPEEAGEDVIRFGIAVNSFINIYARAINPTGVPTVSDKEHARELLSTSFSKGQFRAAMDQLNKEMSAAKASPMKVRKDISAAVSGREPEKEVERGTSKSGRPMHKEDGKWVYD